MKSLRLVLTALAGCGMLGHAVPAAHAQDFPTRPITIVVPFPPGGGIETALRAMAPKLQERLKQPIVFENRTGGGGVIAATSVARAAPDGYTVFAAPSTLATNPKLYKSLPFDTAKDFQPVSLVLRTPYVLVVNPSLPAKTVPELVAYLKQRPGEVSFAHSGPGSSLHLAAELFQTMTGTRMNGVGYRGAVPGLRDVMAGHVALMFADTGTALAQIADGKVRALGVSSPVRLQAAPDIPTLAEAGVPGFDAVGWLLLTVHAGTPAPIVDRLHAEFKAVSAAPDIRALMLRLGTIPEDSQPPAELRRFLASELERWGGLVEKAGVAGTEQ